MSEQSKSHLDKVNGNAKDLTVVVRHEETTGVNSLAIGAQVVDLDEGGNGLIEFQGKFYPAHAEIVDDGDLPDELQFVGFKSHDEFSHKDGTKVSYPEPKFDPVTGRTFINADVRLIINNKACKQDEYHRNRGGRVPCENGTVYDLYTFICPVRYFTGRGKTISDE